MWVPRVMILSSNGEPLPASLINRKPLRNVFRSIALSVAIHCAMSYRLPNSLFQGVKRLLERLSPQGADSEKDLAVEARSFIWVGVEGLPSCISPVMEMNR